MWGGGWEGTVCSTKPLTFSSFPVVALSGCSISPDISCVRVLYNREEVCAINHYSFNANTRDREKLILVWSKIFIYMQSLYNRCDRRKERGGGGVVGVKMKTKIVLVFA